ncbi:MAG: flagellar biosynthesis anti-sigma factor FlgM [Rhodocyclaceae bacterium]|nr:flagellar biosynthesis anti-sigma factor FlgM [Rhodocyclaceae bacterium]
MKIQSNVPGVDTTLPTSGVARSDSRKVGVPATEPGREGDTVRIDPRASLLSAAEASLADAPAIDSTRIDEIKRAIAEGRFEVDSARVADRLLGSVRDLLLTRGD